MRLRIDSLAHGGAGVARHGGRVFFVPGTAPGDVVDTVFAAPQAANARFALAELRQVVEPGEGRATPVCVHAPVCGGCQWQQVTGSAQAHAKVQSVVEALVRLGGLDRASLPEVSFVPSPEPFRYRRRARFSIEASGVLGYPARKGAPAVALRECHLLSPPLEALALSLSRVFRGVMPRPHHVELCVAGARGAALLDFEPPMAAASLRSLGERILAEVPELSGAVVRAGPRILEVGTPELWDGEVLLRPDAFAQANRALNGLLVDAVLAALDPAPRDSVLELFAGHGNFTLPLLRHAREVVAVEREGVSLDALRRAVDRAKLPGLQVIGGDAALTVGDLAGSGRRFDLALLDPPRTGAREVLDALVTLKPRRIVYVSCDPGTLARDVKLLSADYGVRSATVFDQFPQTYHLEALVVLDRRARDPAPRE